MRWRHAVVSAVASPAILEQVAIGAWVVCIMGRDEKREANTGSGKARLCASCELRSTLLSAVLSKGRFD